MLTIVLVVIVLVVKSRTHKKSMKLSKKDPDEEDLEEDTIYG
jgi:hypothetical protein